MDYKKLIIDGYNERGTTSYVSCFKRQAQVAKRDNFVEFADFFNSCKIVTGEWKRGITNRCDIQVRKLDSRISYWQNFIEDDVAWSSKRVIANGGFFDDCESALERHHEECKVDRPQIIRELEQEKEAWQYEKHSIEIYTDDYTIRRGDERRSFFDVTPRRGYITLDYNALVSIEQAFIQAEQELTTAQYPISQQENVEDEKVRYILAPEVEKFIRIQLLPIWKSEVLENTTYSDFLYAITAANFSPYYKRGQMQKVGHFIFSLRLILGDDWANSVIAKLNNANATLSNFQKRKPVKSLKNAMIQF